MEISRFETYRYLGIRGGAADERTAEKVEECIREIEAVMTPRMVYRMFPVTLPGNGRIDFTCFSVKSKNLEKNMKGCDQAVIFAATIGSSVDQLIRRYMKLEVSKGVMMQAAGAAAIEAYCNEVNQKLREEAHANGYFLRPRFSPGYGDFPLECQRLIGDVLKMEKHCGITLTDSLLMLPTKSVTAVIGMGRENTDCEMEGCEVCSHRDGCLYRRA